MKTDINEQHKKERFLVKDFAKILLKYPLGLVNYIFLYLYYKYSKKGKVTIGEMFEPGSKKILVLAPHVDDETIGLGGTLIKHITYGNEVVCLYITDGAGSLTDRTRDEIIAYRKKEAKQIQKTIGISNIYFLDEPDGKVKASEALRDRILQIIRRENPRIIYTPFLIDAHNDHVETTEALGMALKKWDENFKNIFMYEINCPIIPELINSISIMDSDLYKRKEHLLNIFESQQVMAFDGFMLLNRMKGLLTAGKGYGAEAFVKTDAIRLNKTCKHLNHKGFSCSSFRQLSNRYNLLLGFVKGYSYKNELSKEIKDILMSRQAQK